MKVVITGATGNVGTSVLTQLAAWSEVTDIVGVARRAPERTFAKTTFVQADVATDDLRSVFAGADVVIHLAWLIQPGRDLNTTTAVNVNGSRRVFDAVAQAGVPSLVYASSVGAYSPGPKDRRVDESWPTDGIKTSFYSRHKAAVERILDRFESEHPTVRVVRLRPGLIFKAQAGTEVRRLFLGPFMPTTILRRGWVPVVPDLSNLCVQAVHSLDIAAAYTLAAVNPGARGPFNIAADPVIGPQELAGVLGARRVPVPRSLLRGAVDCAYRLRVSPTEPGWLDMALEVPLMDCGRAERELGWVPQHGAVETLAEMIEGIGQGTDDGTPPLARSTTAPARINEVKTRLGSQG
jgi:UDP-glucose 4-epimerase